jgi:preprotein translocase subunit SecF
MEEIVQKEKEKFGTKVARFHDRHYKHLLLIPLLILLLCAAYMVVFYSQHGDFTRRDISLTGGTSITLYQAVPASQIQADLGSKLESLDVRELSDLVTREQKGVVIETTTNDTAAKAILENYLGYNLTEQNSSIEFTGSSLSSSFFKQLMIAVIAAFVLMAIVVFLLFRTAIPAGAVILSAFADIFMTLTLFNMTGMKLSSAGIVAFLMLIGYSVDTDILLTNRVLRRHDATIDRKIWGAFKTGMTMTLTSLFAVLLAFIVIGSLSSVLKQIFTILIIGLLFDMFNTWITNVSIIKWYAIKKEAR